MHQIPPDDSGVRSHINRHPAIAASAVAAVLGLVLLVRLWPTRGPQAFYSIDDGQSFFAHAYVVPPFQYKGQEAVQAMVYTCDHGQTRFVGYLMRFTPEGRAQMQQKLAARSGRDERSPLSLPNGVEVKRPGPGDWVGQSTPAELGQKVQKAIAAGRSPERALKSKDAYAQITDVKCPDGKGMAVPVGAD